MRHTRLLILPLLASFVGCGDTDPNVYRPPPPKLRKVTGIYFDVPAPYTADINQMEAGANQIRMGWKLKVHVTFNRLAQNWDRNNQDAEIEVILYDTVNPTGNGQNLFNIWSGDPSQKIMPYGVVNGVRVQAYTPYRFRVPRSPNGNFEFTVEEVNRIKPDGTLAPRVTSRSIAGPVALARLPLADGQGQDVSVYAGLGLGMIVPSYNQWPDLRNFSVPKGLSPSEAKDFWNQAMAEINSHPPPPRQVRSAPNLVAMPNFADLANSSISFANSDFLVCPCGSDMSDDDGDGSPNCNDGCPNDPLKISPGQCGCGVPDIDTDGDGIADCLDACPTNFWHSLPGTCVWGDFDGNGSADMDDFGLIQACWTGSKADPSDPTVLYDPSCAPADYNRDGAIDQADLNVFLRCASGAGVAMDPNCAP